MKKRSLGINGSTLKIIALIAMIFDHIGAILLEPEMNSRGIFQALVWESNSFMEFFSTKDQVLATVWWVFRIIIGRMAFPIFCFLLVEGFLHTKNVYKYMINLFVFGIISEIPFDLAIFHKVFYWEYQNVFFTLFIGLLCLHCFDLLNRKFVSRFLLVNLISKSLITIVGIVCGYVFKTDYAGMGVLFILILYVFRNTRNKQIVAGCIGSMLILREITALIAFLFIGNYNGERGMKLKYFFYIIYPLHLFVLYLISMVI